MLDKNDDATGKAYTPTPQNLIFGLVSGLH